MYRYLEGMTIIRTISKLKFLSWWKINHKQSKRTIVDDDTIRRRGIASENVFARKQEWEQLRELRRIHREKLKEKIKAEMRRLEEERTKL